MKPESIIFIVYVSVSHFLAKREIPMHCYLSAKMSVLKPGKSGVQITAFTSRTDLPFK